MFNITNQSIAVWKVASNTDFHAKDSNLVFIKLG